MIYHIDIYTLSKVLLFQYDTNIEIGDSSCLLQGSSKVKLLSDIEKLDIMLGSNHLERQERELSNSVRRPESPNYNALVNHDVNSYPNSREDEIRGYARNGQNSGEVDSSSENSRLSGELNQRITQELSSQIPRAISEAKNEQVLPQIQATLRSE